MTARFHWPLFRAIALALFATATEDSVFDPKRHELTLSEGVALHAQIGGTAGEHVGQGVRVLPDVDGDGTADLALTARPWVAGFNSGVGWFQVRSGRTFERLYRVDGEWADESRNGSDLFGQILVPVGDVTGDGVPDLFASGGDDLFGGGYLLLLSGADGTTVVRHEGDAVGLSPLGDVDGDGALDVGARKLGYPTRTPTRVFSGADGSPIGTLAPALVRRTGDLDGDGRRDYIACDDSWRPTGVVSSAIGAESQTLLTFPVPSEGEVYTSRVDVDLDGDGFIDPLRVHYLPGRRGNTRPAEESAFDVFVQNGRDGSLLLELRIPLEGSGHLMWVGGLTDLDGDGSTELGVSTYEGEHGRLTIRSGATGEVLAWASGPPTFGSAVASAGDLDGDGTHELVVGAYEHAEAGQCAGAAFVLSVDLGAD